VTERREEAAETIVRDALLCSIALVTRDVEQFDVAPAVLLEGADATLVAQVLAMIAATALGELLPGDGGRHLLIRIGRQAVERRRP
jgi:hypothetical protein